MHKLVLLRHGESTWNKENRFTGWVDVDLSDKGTEEAIKAGKLLRGENSEFDLAFTSVLKRAIRTLWLVQEMLDLMWIPVVKSWRLNERHYGALQGLNKAETAAKFGDEQVHQWRRGYAVRPPELERNNPMFPGNDPRYKDLRAEEIPLSECLKDTVKRFLPFWHDAIVPALKSGKRIIIVAHGNSLRALVKYLDDISDDAIAGLNIPTGMPLIYELDDHLKAAKHYYLGDPDEVKAAIDSVAKQAKGK